ncbi:MAG: hypothetical protein V1735_07930 [Nanoarchaeota archaeon]
MKKSLKKPLVKNILSALAVAVFGFILLNITFLFDFLFQSAIRGVIMFFIPLGPETESRGLSMLFHASFAVFICLISWFVLRTKMRTLFKAIFMTVPVATVLVTMGMFLYPWPFVLFPAGGLLCLATLYIFYRTRQPWLYSFAVILVGLVLMIFTMTGGEI